MEKAHDIDFVFTQRRGTEIELVGICFGNFSAKSNRSVADFAIKTRTLNQIGMLQLLRGH